MDWGFAVATVATLIAWPISAASKAAQKIALAVAYAACYVLGGWRDR